MAYADLKNKLDEYDWDDGFKAPRTILADPDCDLALALEIFYLAGGYEYLEKSARRTKLQKWNPFITVLSWINTKSVSNTMSTRQRKRKS